MELQEIRKLIKKRLENEVGGVIFCADWQDNRIAWEESSLSTMYHTDFAKFDEIITKVCEGTGYFIELINSCEGEIHKE